MQCPSCHFHNMPGSGQCARCGASLRLTAAVDVHPPRAGAWQKKLPSLWRLRAASRRFVDAAWEGISGVFGVRGQAAGQLPRGISGWMLPGWAQLQRGDRGLGLAYLLTWGGTLLPGLMLLGTFPGSLLLGLAFSAHLAALLDGVAASFATAEDRIRLALFIAFGLGLCVYGPVGWAASRVAMPVRINQDSPPLAAGDVVWYNRLASIEPGDYVLYDVPAFSAAGRTAGGYAARFEIRGLRINRVVARAGQRVEWRGERLLVDGAPSRWQPASGAALADFGVTVPAGSYYVLPENLIPVGAAPNGLNPWTALGVVGQTRIYGQAALRSYPWTRISLIR